MVHFENVSLNICLPEMPGQIATSMVYTSGLEANALHIIQRQVYQHHGNSGQDRADRSHQSPFAAVEP
eukprot:6456996-Amphidinium_carterae.2